ncbi:hypothetical protein [Marisediminicola sp. LYQ134]|uniref:hypothetical protein n=1 Tax=Marisediminicola sp. LYQ134 TaxID=3391061 RepID=UPI0039830185
MTSLNDSFALVFEVLTWVGLGAGVTLLLIGYGIRLFAGRFVETWGVVIVSPTEPSALSFRWMDLDRILHSSRVPPDAPGEPRLGDEVTVHFDKRDPAIARLDDPRLDGRGVRIAGWLLVAIGIVSTIVQVVAVLLE